MARRKAAASGQKDAVRERIKFLLGYRWKGSQRQMARDLGVTQGLISKVVNGQQGAGGQFLAALAGGGVNARWLSHGEGEPFTGRLAEGDLPISDVVLPGPPGDSPRLLTGQGHPVAASMKQESQYWLRLGPGAALLDDPALRLHPNDLLLMETSPEMTSRLEFVVGRICGVRQRQRGASAAGYVLARLLRGEDGDEGAELRTACRVAGLGRSDPRPDWPPFQRKPRNVLLASEGPPAHESKPSAPPKPADGPPDDRGTPVGRDDVVAVCIYLARPQPHALAFA